MGVLPGPVPAEFEETETVGTTSTRTTTQTGASKPRHLPKSAIGTACDQSHFIGM